MRSPHAEEMKSFTQRRRGSQRRREDAGFAGQLFLPRERLDVHENEISGEIVDAACRIHRRIGPRVVWIRLRADSAIRDRATRTTNAVCAWRRPHGGRTSRPRIARITRIKTGIRAFCDPWNPWCRVRSFSTTDCTNNTDQDRNPGLVLGDQLVLPYPGDTLVWMPPASSGVGYLLPIALMR